MTDQKLTQYFGEPIFVGTSAGGDPVTVSCPAGDADEYCIVRNGQVVSRWSAEQLSACLRVFFAMIERTPHVDSHPLPPAEPSPTPTDAPARLAS